MTPSRRQLEATRLRHLAEDGQALVYWCRRCRKETVILAADVLDIWGPEMKVYEPPAPCGVCGGGVIVRFRTVTEYDRGKLLLRRPAGVRTIQLWKDELY